MVLYRTVLVTNDDTRPAPRRRTPQPKRPGPTRRVVHILLVLVAIVIVTDALVGDQGLLAMLRARRQYDQLAGDIARQRTENVRLREEARRLKEDPTAIEEVARRDLGLIRPGEKVFIVKDLPSPEIK
jgi:cell division protein FtsB